MSALKSEGQKQRWHRETWPPTINTPFELSLLLFLIQILSGQKQWDGERFPNRSQQWNCNCGQTSGPRDSWLAQSDDMCRGDKWGKSLLPEDMHWGYSTPAQYQWQLWLWEMIWAIYTYIRQPQSKAFSFCKLSPPLYYPLQTLLHSYFKLFLDGECLAVKKRRNL